MSARIQGDIYLDDNGGVMAGLIRDFDWSRTPIGPSDQWPISLQTLVKTIEASRFPMALLWGPDLILIYNDGYMEICADKHPAALGRSTREVWLEVWHINKPIFESVMDRGETLYFEDMLFPIIRNGSREEAYFTLCYSPVRIEDGRVGGTLVILEETTGRKQAQESLQASEKKYRALFENTTAEVHFWELVRDAHGAIKTWRLIDINPAGLKGWGKTRAETIGKTADEIFPGATDHFMPIVRKIFTDGTPHSWESYFPGTDQHLSMTSFPFGDYFVTTGIDISAIRKAADALKKSDQRFRIALKASSVTLFSLDNDLRYTWAYNPSPGFNVEAVLGKRDDDIYSPEDAAVFTAIKRQVLATGQGRRDEVTTHRPAAGGDMVHDMTTEPLRDDSGRIVGVICAALDITERKRVEAALSSAKDAAERATKAKSEFLARMSHELRTPLNSVIGFANILLKNMKRNLSHDELLFIQRIQSNGRHLLFLINEILDLSRIEAGRSELHLAPVAMDTLVRETVAEFTAQLQHNHVALLLDLPTPVAPVITDAMKVKQLLINLIGNALKFTPKGSVTVRMKTEPVTHVPSCIRVEDTGIGIPGDRLAVIFEPFTQADGSTTRKYGGTGLGLTISKLLCQLLGFRLDVESEMGHGSTFTIALGSFPASPAASSADKAMPEMPRAISTAFNGDGKLVLVVDDEMDSRLLLACMVEACGFRIITADSGEQAMRQLRSLHPDLVLLDLLMPQMDGWAVLEQMKGDPALRDIPVIIVTALAREQTESLLGAMELLQKPLNPEQLRTVMQNCLQRRPDGSVTSP